MNKLDSSTNKNKLSLKNVLQAARVLSVALLLGMALVGSINKVSASEVDGGGSPVRGQTYYYPDGGCTSASSGSTKLVCSADGSTGTIWIYPPSSGK